MASKKARDKNASTVDFLRGRNIIAGAIPQEVGAQAAPDTSRVDNAFFTMLKGAVPRTHHGEIDAIIQGPGSVLERGERIRQRITQMVGEKVPGLKFKDPAPVSMWYNERAAQYKEKVEDQQERLRSNVSGGMGMAAVGQMEWESGTDQENIQRISADKNDINTFVIDHMRAVTATGASEDVINAVVAYLRTPLTYQAMDALINNDIPPPFNFLLLRPHQQYRTKAIVKCAQDGKTGYTFIGNSNTLIGHQTNIKMAQLNYTTHMRSVITQPKNVYVQPDVMCVGYEGGGGCRFWTPETYAQLDLDNLRASLIAVAVPLAETHFPWRLDITGRFHTTYNISLSQQGRYNALHYSTAYRYAVLYGFGRGGQFSDTPHMAPGRHHRNRICYQGHQKNYNPNTSAFDRIIVGKGHWGKTSYAGSRDARTGKLMEVEGTH